MKTKVRVKRSKENVPDSFIGNGCPFYFYLYLLS